MTTFVNVACKLPNGHIIELPGKGQITLVGSKSPEAVAGFGITRVEKGFWEAWAARHKDFPPLVQGLIFAQERADSVRAEAKEKTGLKTGLEGLDPEKPAPGVKAEAYQGKKKEA